MGYAWSYPLVRLLAGKKVPIGAYVHYPTIRFVFSHPLPPSLPSPPPFPVLLTSPNPCFSGGDGQKSPDMVHRVANRLHTHTNVSIARSPVRSAMKLVYYRVLIGVYAWCLGYAQEVMANSTWTKGHLDTLLGSGSSGADAKREGKEGRERVVKVCPPCDMSELVGLSLDEQGRERVVLSLAQFRSVFPFPHLPANTTTLFSVSLLLPSFLSLPNLLSLGSRSLT